MPVFVGLDQRLRAEAEGDAPTSRNDLAVVSMLGNALVSFDTIELA